MSLVAVLGLALLVTGCDDATLTPSPAPSAPLVPSPSLPGSSAEPSRSPDAELVSPSPPAALPDFAAIEHLWTKGWRSGEAFLNTGFREDLLYDMRQCGPRRDDLPEGATDGVECTGPGVVVRIGAYLFPDAATARAAFENRLAENGLAPGDDGGCPFAAPGSDIRTDAMPVAACFRNEFGVANLRVFWPGQGVVVGVLWRDGSIDDLEAWARGNANSPTAGLLDPWVGSLGPEAPFPACPDAPKPDRVVAGTTIAYEGGDGIWLTDPEGTRKRRLTARGFKAQWSPDGRQLAYLVEGGGGHRLRLLDVKTGSSRRLADFRVSYESGAISTSIIWSPDGRWIGVTEMWDVGDPELNVEVRTSAATWLVDPASGRARRLVEGKLLAWSPDATRVLVRQDENANSGYPGDIALVDVPTGATTLLGRADSGTFAADCRFVTLETGPGREADTAVVLDGVARRPVLAAEMTGVDWGPSAAELALGVRGRGIWRASFDAQRVWRVQGGSDPEWSDDGRRLALFTPKGLVVADAEGGNDRLVARAAFPIFAVTWSPDGKYLASSGEMTYDTCSPPDYGFVIAADGSGVRALPSPYHAIWRPIEPPPADARLEGERPPKAPQGCGG